MYALQTRRFSTERELQDHCLRVLKSKGIHCREEVWNGDIRADIVTSKAVIECKKTRLYRILYANVHGKHLGAV